MSSALFGEQQSEVQARLREQRTQIEYHMVATSRAAADAHDEKNGGRTSLASRLLGSPSFHNTMAVIILLNGVVIGLETDISSFHYWELIESIFLLVFLAEVCLKMYVEGRKFFNPYFHDFSWNVFDCCVVGIGLFDFVSSRIGMSGSGGFATIFRMARLMRVLRILRLLKFLKKLYLLAVGLVEAWKAIFWVTLLMSAILYVCSIVLVKTLGRTPHTDPNYDFLVAHFGNIPVCMVSLFEMMSSPNLPIYQDAGVLDTQPVFTIFSILFICFGSFGITAMLTGVIQESMFENNEVRQEEKRLEHENRRKRLSLLGADLYETLPLDAEGKLPMENLDQVVQPAGELLDHVGANIDHSDIRKFLEMMDDDNSGCIDMKEFVEAIEKLAEGVSPLAILEVQHHLTQCNYKLIKQFTHMTSIEDKIEIEVRSVLKYEEKIMTEILQIMKRLDALSEVVAESVMSKGSPPFAQETQNVQTCASTAQINIDRMCANLEVALVQHISNQFANCVSSVESHMQLAVSSKMLSIEDSLQKLLDGANVQPKLDEILGCVQQLIQEEAAVTSLNSELTELIRDGKQNLKSIPEMHDTIKEEVQFEMLMNKLSVLEKETDFAQNKLIGCVAELGGDIISSMSELLSQCMVTLRQDLALQTGIMAKPDVQRCQTVSTALDIPMIARRAVQHSDVDAQQTDGEAMHEVSRHSALEPLYPVER